MGEAAAVIGTAITTVGLIAVAIIRQGGQARESKRAGVEGDDVQAGAPAAPPDPGQSWERLVQRLEARITRLDERIERVEEEIKVERDLRWLAIQHIRQLYAWITKHIPGVDPPPVPDELTPYIVIPRREP